jgi:hypothetical protein
MADRLGREDQRVEVELLEIFRRLLLQRDGGIAAGGADQAGVVGAIGVGWQVATAMRGDDLPPREAIEGALEDQVRERDRGFERIADGVAEPAIAGRRVAIEASYELVGIGTSRCPGLKPSRRSPCA